jgi:hypothetical protein
MERDRDQEVLPGPASLSERLTLLTIERGGIQSRAINGLMIFLIAVIALSILYISHTNGPAATSMFIGDDFILFDGAWRAYNDQASSDDYYNPLGFLYFFVFGLAMKVLGPQVTTITYAAVAINLALLLWSWSVFRRRLSFAMAIALTLAIGANLFSNKVFGHQFYIVGFAGYYNKIGITLLSIIFALSFLNQPGTKTTPLSALGAIGFALGLTFAVKVSYCIIAVPSVLLGLYITGGSSIKKLAWGSGVVVLAGLGTIGLLSLATGTSLSSYLADLGMAAEARNFLALPVVLDFVTQWYFVLCVVLVGAVVMYLLPRNDRAKLLQFLSLAGFGLATIALVDLTNSAPMDFQFLCTLLAILCSFSLGGEPLIAEASRLRGSHGTALRSSYLILLLFPFAVVILIGGISGGFGHSLTYNGLRYPERALTIPTPAMAGWRGVGLAGREPSYVKSVQAGLKVLKEVARPQDTVQVLDYVNPFSFALGQPPAQGGALWWHSTYNMTPKQLASTAQSLIKACILMYPIQPFVEVIRDQMFSPIEQEISRGFYVIKEGDYWKVFVNRNCR